MFDDIGVNAVFQDQKQEKQSAVANRFSKMLNGVR